MQLFCCEFLIISFHASLLQSSNSSSMSSTTLLDLTNLRQCFVSVVACSFCSFLRFLWRLSRVGVGAGFAFVRAQDCFQSRRIRGCLAVFCADSFARRFL